MTEAAWDDNKNGMGLDNAGDADTLSCVADRMSRCVWKSGSLRRVFSGSGDEAGTGFDNQLAQGLDDACERWFTHHADAVGGAGTGGHQCYKRSPTARCFSAGSACQCSFQSAYPVHENVVISVREFDDDIVLNALESLVCPYNQQRPAPSCTVAVKRCKGDGVYWLQPQAGGIGAFTAYCDADGWMKVRTPVIFNNVHVIGCIWLVTDLTAMFFNTSHNVGCIWLVTNLAAVFFATAAPSKIFHAKGSEYSRQWTSSTAKRAVGNIATKVIYIYI